MQTEKFFIELDYDILCADDFDYVANVLLNYTYLMVRNVGYRLVEIEFYLNNAHHPDLYVHSNPDQLLLNKFYFHKFKNGTYKSGTFKGLDLTFGDNESKTYFGILIRAVLNTQTDQLIEGPCNVVNHVLSQYGFGSVVELTERSVLSLHANIPNFILVRTDELDTEPMFIGPRIGLSEKYPEYQHKCYRYVIYRNRTKKQKNKLFDL